MKPSFGVQNSILTIFASVESFSKKHIFARNTSEIVIPFKNTADLPAKTTYLQPIGLEKAHKKLGHSKFFNSSWLYCERNVSDIRKFDKTNFLTE